jgi:hypothetical protein
MNFDKKKRLLLLFAWTVLLALIYFGFQETKYTMAITYVYFALCLILSVFYILVNGGLRPIMTEDRQREAKTREKYLADKGKMHPVKRKDKYRRFRIKKEQEEEKVPSVPPPPRANPLKLSEERQNFISRLLLVLVIPFYLIFMIDWIYLFFFWKG